MSYPRLNGKTKTCLKKEHGLTSPTVRLASPEGLICLNQASISFIKKLKGFSIESAIKIENQDNPISKLAGRAKIDGDKLSKITK